MLGRAGAGDAVAKQELFDTFAHRLRWAIRRKLNDRLRTAYDSDDFMQEARMVLLQDEAERTIFSSPDAFAAYMVGAAEKIVRQANRKHLGEQKRNLQREVSLDAGCVDPEKDLVSSRPGPKEEAEAKDEWQRVVRACPPRHVAILQLLRQGYSSDEIKAKLGLNEKTIRRLRQRLRKDLRQ